MRRDGGGEPLLRKGDTAPHGKFNFLAPLALDRSERHAYLLGATVGTRIIRVLPSL
jgi:hypothetical protein